MKFMLDTNICIYIIKKKPAQVLRHLKRTPVSEIGISSITFSELEYGVEKSERKAQNRFALVQFIVPLQIILYDEIAARYYGEIRSTLEREGQLIGPLDMLIAAHAKSLNSILITNNENEFKRVAGLKLRNWI